MNDNERSEERKQKIMEKISYLLDKLSLNNLDKAEKSEFYSKYSELKKFIFTI